MSDDLPPLGPELEGLLKAAKDELPSAAAKAKARAALGLPAVAPPPSTAPAAPSAAPGTAAGTGAASASVGVTTVKVGLVVALVGASFAVGLKVGDSRAREELAALPPKTVIVEKLVPAPPPPVVEPPVVVAEVVDAGLAVPPVKPPKKVEAPAEDDLSAELALLDGAKKALAAKDAPTALAVLTKYDAAFPRGAMRTDAQLLQLEALLLGGKRREAEALGKKVSTATDSELVRDRVRRLLDAK